MATRFETVELVGHTFTVQQLPARAAANLLWRLGQMVAPALKEVGAAATTTKNLADMDVGAVLGGLGEVLRASRPEEVEAVREELFRHVLVQTREGGMEQLGPRLVDELFRGEVHSLFHLTAKALQVNYGNFFSALAAVLPKARAAAQAQTSVTLRATSGA